jgi:hypothetical protein
LRVVYRDPNRWNGYVDILPVRALSVIYFAPHKDSSYQSRPGHTRDLEYFGDLDEYSTDFACGLYPGGLDGCSAADIHIAYKTLSFQPGDRDLSSGGNSYHPKAGGGRNSHQKGVGVR